MRMKSAAVVRQALANRALRRVLIAYLIFNICEWATWITLLVWAYERGGVRAAGTVALAQLVPSALLAAPVASLCQRMSRGRALKAGYAAQSLTSLSLGVALVAEAPALAVGALAALGAVAITATRPLAGGAVPTRTVRPSPPSAAETSGEQRVTRTRLELSRSRATLHSPRRPRCRLMKPAMSSKP